MPTYEARERFRRELAKLSPELRDAFRAARGDFIAAADSGVFPARLRVKRIKSVPGMWEMSFAKDGRATFERETGTVEPGRVHIRWHRIGGHEVLQDPRAH